MASSYSSLSYHFVFGTKDRAPHLQREIEERVWAYLGGVARERQMSALQIGGIEDHVHVLVIAPRTLSPSQMARYLKTSSSKWIHETFPELRGFAWQDGYGVFTVSKSNLPAVIRYIQRQRDHHRRKTFQEEYLEILQRHEIEYDERYMWG